MTDVWQTRWAPTERELAACVECGLCLPHCPTFRLTGDEAASPRGRLNAMAAVAAGEIPLDADFDEVMSFCLQCRGCEAACPSLVPFGRAMEGARAELSVARRTPARRFRQRILGWWITNRLLVRVATVLVAIAQRLGVIRWLPGRIGRGARGLRRLPVLGRTVVGREVISADADRAPGPVVGLLAGCIVDPWFQRVHEATIATLTAAGYRVVVPRRQTCCGALAAHEGAADRAADLAEQNVRAFAGVDVLVANAAGCTAHLRTYEEWVPDGGVAAESTVDMLELLVEALEEHRLQALTAGDVPVAIQDPCHHRHALRLVEPARVVVRAAGFRPVDIDPDGLCCGAAGAYSMLYPEASAELGRRKAEQVLRSGAGIVASANPGCEMQLRAHLPSNVRVVHPVELYAEAAGLL